jgi:hypothetical protein
VKAAIAEEIAADCCNSHSATCPTGHSDTESVLFKNNCLYKHNILRINYTSYNIWRLQDVINPKTSHCDIIGVVEDNDDDDAPHCFWYATVLGVYYANVVYIGPDAVDYQLCRMEFLWV